jgi:ABC-type multidrug transport system ATPase subunit
MTPQSTTQQRRSASKRETVVSVDGLGHAFGDLDVLGDISFTIEAGTVACLIGPNGSGKTTLLRLVAGLLDPDDGSVTVAESGDRRVGYLAQQPAFRPQFSVRETIEFYGALVDDEVNTEGVLERVGLSAVADRRVDALSGGMMRLLGIAQTTVGDPPVLVLDEPSSGLDPMMTRHITSVVEDLADDGDAVLVATHDLRSVERVADTVLVVDRGELVATGAPDVILDETGTDTLEDALGTLSRNEGAVGVSAGLQGGGES